MEFVAPDSAPLALQLFGGFNASKQGLPLVTFESDRARALLVYLAVEGQKVHTRDHLAGLLWPEMENAHARHNLSQVLYHLRALLWVQEGSPPLFLVTKNTIQLNGAGILQVDVAAFEAALNRCFVHNHSEMAACETCAGWLSLAVNLYQGEFLAGFSLKDANLFEEWCLITREHLHRKAVQASNTLITYSVQQGETPKALEIALKQAEWDPFDEHSCRQVMRLLSSMGQHNQALSHYQKFCCLIEAELGVPPDAETTLLADKIRAAITVPPAELIAPHNLPARLTRFVGRKTEIGALSALLRQPDNRLVSLIGPGGSGKSSLAVEAVRSLLGDFPDGVFFVPLDGVTRLVGILPVLVEALGILPQEGVLLSTLVLNFLRDKKALLVLDGYEKFLPRTDLIGEILSAAGQVKILITSRVKLNTRYEVCYTLGGLRLPEPGAALEDARVNDAVLLFLSGARQVLSHFALDQDNYQAVIQICQIVQGMPLGILLASAWVPVLPAAEIAAKIQRNLDFLVVDWQDMPERLRSLRAAFNYSWELLSSQNQKTLQGLSVFRGGFDLLAAEQITGCTLEHLLSLMDRSLLQRTTAGRFELHELIRQYAAEKLSQKMSAELDIRQQHGLFYLARLNSLAETFKSAGQRQALLDVDLDVENILQAWTWAVDNQRGELVSRASLGLGIYLDLRGRLREGEQAFRIGADKFNAEPGVDHPSPARLKVLAWLFYFICLLNKLGDSQSLADEVFASLDQAKAAGEETDFERGLIQFGIGQGRQNLNLKREALQSALEIFRQVDETWWVARVLIYLSISQNRLGLYAQAVQGLEESITLWRQVGDRDGLANSLRTLSFSYLHSGRLQNAAEIMEEAAEIFYTLGTWNDIANADSLRGLVYLSLGRLAEGCTWLDKSLETFQKFGLGSREAFLHNVLGIGRLHLGEYAQVLFHARQAYTLAEEAGLRREVASARILLGCLHMVNDKTAAACQEFEDAVTIYRRMGYTQELDLALCYGGLALRRSGESDRAVEALCAALHLHQHSGSFTGAAAILPLAALLLLDRGDLAKAWQIWRLGAQHPLIGGSVWTREIARDLLQTRADNPHDGANPAAEPGEKTPGELNKHLSELLKIFEPHAG